MPLQIPERHSTTSITQSNQPELLALHPADGAFFRCRAKFDVTANGAEVELHFIQIFTGCIVDGPLALDVALSPEACEIKGLNSSVDGQADILVFPNIETGNVFYKASTLLANARLAAAVVGTSAPCVLTSRADNEESKFLSIAMGCRLVR